MKIETAKKWFWWHKWTSLICTVFLLLLCLTGLPLIFHHEIEDLSTVKPAGPEKILPHISLDTPLKQIRKDYPKKVVRFLFWLDEEPNHVFFSLTDSLKAPLENYKIIRIDAVSGKYAAEVKPDEGFMYIMLKLHTDLFLGIGGKLFMGLMGILFVIALISGVVLYGPIMKKFDFGIIRSEKSRRLKWLDMHNMLGMVTLVWTFIVGFTGVINTMSDVILSLWQQGQLKEMTAPYANRRAIQVDSLFSLQEVTENAKKAAPGMKLSFMSMPGTAFTSGVHYAVFVKGTTPLTTRMIMPLLIDGKNGEIADKRKMSWFVDALFLSQPLHFGDYGGLPLKIIWALLDVATIAILVSGLVLWVLRFKAARAQLKRLI